LAAFRAVAESIGAKPIVLVIPDKAQVDPASRAAMAEAIADPAYDPARPYRGMINAAEATGLPVVDPIAALDPASEAGARALYFGKDWHTNGIGNRVLADRLAQALAMPSLLGAPMRTAAPLALPTAEATSPLAHWLRVAALALAIWLALGTLYWQRFP